MRTIFREMRTLARDQNCVFVERASARKLSANDATLKYGLARGKGNAFIEFDVEPERVLERWNGVLKTVEC